mmetsp:Transcript_6344/g.20865  ORF Transcript_6344/g.20865 Transcript_6344/m.20865 type:complete len:236 (-) Transcript_6344:222-929(-)
MWEHACKALLLGWHSGYPRVLLIAWRITGLHLFLTGDGAIEPGRLGLVHPHVVRHHHLQRPAAPGDPADRPCHRVLDPLVGITKDSTAQEGEDGHRRRVSRSPRPGPLEHGGQQRRLIGRLQDQPSQRLPRAQTAVRITARQRRAKRLAHSQSLFGRAEDETVGGPGHLHARMQSDPQQSAQLIPRLWGCGAELGIELPQPRFVRLGVAVTHLHQWRRIASPVARRALQPAKQLA